MSKLNVDLVAMVAYRLLKEGNSLWVNRFKSRYVKDGNF